MPNIEVEHLIKMMNQIADNIAIGESDAVAADKLVAHIKRFWARSMIQKIVEYAESDGEKLQAVSKQAVTQLAAAEREA